MQKICFQNIMPKVFQSLTIQSEVWGQSLCFERGQTYLIEAESGRGKSTLCSYMVGYRDDYAGKLLFDDADARSFSIAQWTEIRQRRVSMLFQELRLFSELTAMENVMLKNRLTGHKEDCFDPSFQVPFFTAQDAPPPSRSFQSGPPAFFSFLLFRVTVRYLRKHLPA